MLQDSHCIINRLVADQIQHDLILFGEKYGRISNTALASMRYTPFGRYFVVFAPAWPLKVLVGANSPSLWPTISSVTYTGTCLRPSWTAKV